MSGDARVFATEAALDDLRARFDAAQIPNEEWTHYDHLAIAALYILDGRNLDDVRAGIQKLNAANGIEQTLERGYHETITRAWMILIGEFLSRLPPDMARLRKIENVLGEFGNKRYLLRYYSRDRIMSSAARYGWVEPDLEPFQT